MLEGNKKLIELGDELVNNEMFMRKISQWTMLGLRGIRLIDNRPNRFKVHSSALAKK
jgi:hypothetical protein